MKKLFYLLGFLALWCLTVWIAYWAGFSKSQVISQYVRHLDDVNSLIEKRSLLKSMDNGNVSGVKRALNEQIATDSKIIGIGYGDQKSDTSWLDELRPLIYPRESLILMDIYKDSKRNHSRPASTTNPTASPAVPSRLPSDG